jgi:CO/xanthine dehydrogenase Mo-binding subunit
MGAKLFGASVPRREDPRLLRGEGRFVDDMKLPGMLHAAFVRSPHAHARVLAIRTEEAARRPGVFRIFTFADLERWMKPLPLFGAIPPGLAARVEVSMKQVGQLAMARDVVRHVGEIVAMVVADSRALAEDAAELVEVDYDPLPAVVDMVAGSEPGAPVIHAAWGDNVALRFKTGFGDAAAALKAADVRVHERFFVQRYVGMPMETRGVLAHWDIRDGSLTTWNGTQVVHFVQQGLVAALGLPAHKIRVIAPDVGGGFGTKANGYPEDLLIPAAAIACRRPVKWTEDRREHMLGSAHARHQVHDIEIGASREGKMLVVRDRIWVDLGAYNSWGIVLPYNTVAHLLGPHRVPALEVECQGVVTNKTPNAPYRGAGRPEAVYAMDRIVDCLARELRMDPAELRRRNYLAAADLPYELDIPYRDGNRLVYDSGDFRANLDAALGRHRLRAAARRAGGGAERSRRPARPRHLRLRRGHRHRALRGRDGSDGCDRSGGGGHRRVQPGAGARDLVRPGGRGRARHPARLGHRRRRRHRGDPVRHRHLRQPQRGERGQLHRGRRRSGAGQAHRGGRRASRGLAFRRGDRGRDGGGARHAGLGGVARPCDPLRAAHVREAGAGDGRLRGDGIPPPAHRDLHERGAHRPCGGGRGHGGGAPAALRGGP